MMITSSHAALLIAIMAIVTMVLRFLPFVAFRNEIPPYISYLGEVLPPAIIGMLVIYCLKDVHLSVSPFGLPELLAGLAVVLAQWRSRKSLVSILTGTIVYMILIRLF